MSSRLFFTRAPEKITSALWIKIKTINNDINMKSIKEFISIVSLSILIISCSQNNKIHFTPKQRVKDIKFLSSYLKNNLPSIGFWGKKYNVSFDSLSNHFISLAATCRNDTDFFLLTLAYITSLKGNGHTGTG